MKTTRTLSIIAVIISILALAMNIKNNIEAEGGELIIRNEAGDYAIIPKKHRQEVLDMVKEGCNGCLDNYISTLPVAENYAEDGTLIEGEEPVKTEPQRKRKIYYLAETKTEPEKYMDPGESNKWAEYVTSKIEEKYGMSLSKARENEIIKRNELHNNPVYQEMLQRERVLNNSEMTDESKAELASIKLKMDELYNQTVGQAELTTKEMGTMYEQTFKSVDEFNAYRKSLNKPPVATFTDDTFIRVGNDFKKKFPNEDIEIIPFYGYEEEEKVNDVYKKVLPGDVIAFAGHNSTMLGGIHIDDLAAGANQLIKDKTGVECYMGSCRSSQFMAPQFARGSQIPTYGYEDSWWGFLGQNKDLKSSFGGYTMSPDQQVKYDPQMKLMKLFK